MYDYRDEDEREYSKQEQRIAELEAENAELRAEVERLREALEGLVTDPEDDPCWYDHHGYCQAHGLNAPCEMAIARAALGSDHNG